MSAIQEKINKYIEDNKDVLIETIQQAVRIPSVIGNEQNLQTFMKELYTQIGLKVVEIEPDYDMLCKHEAFCDSYIPFEGRKNIIGIYESDQGGKSLTLHGHTDVVSPFPLEKWTKDPWGAEIEGNKLYGRGAGDMKAGLIANWFALKALFDLGIKPEGTVQLHSVIEEESGSGGGALACMEAGYVTDGFVSTEPHFLKITIAHAGIMYFRVKVLGKTAHGGLAHLGVNAISKMYKIFNALENLDKKRAKEVRFELFEKGSGQAVHLNLGTLKGGDWVSSVAGEAILEARIGFVPSETRAEIKQLIENTIQEAIKGDEWLEENPPTIEWFGWTTEAWYQDPEDPYILSFKETAERILNREVEIQGRASGNDARFTQYYNRPGICFGPRGINIHGPDEYVEIDSVLETTKVIANHIVDWTKK